MKGMGMDSRRKSIGSAVRQLVPLALVWAVLASPLLASVFEQGAAQRTFATPEDAVRALAEAVKKGSLDDLLALLGAEGQEIVDTSDAATARHNREIFSVAFTEGWRLQDQGANRKVLIVGNEAWPFPIPIVMQGNSWRFDTAAGKEELFARRIGRNELTVIQTCRAYVTAQQRYAQSGHDGKPAGLFAQTFASDPGKQNGLYWPTAPREPRSPLGDVIAEAAEDGRAATKSGEGRLPFHGYYFKILTGQGAAAPGGAKSYVVKGEMSGGHALVAWPAQYDASGVMTFIVNQDGIVQEKDLGPRTNDVVAKMTVYNPDASWKRVE